MPNRRTFLSSLVALIPAWLVPSWANGTVRPNGTYPGQSVTSFTIHKWPVGAEFTNPDGDAKIAWTESRWIPVTERLPEMKPDMIGIGKVSEVVLIWDAPTPGIPWGNVAMDRAVGRPDGSVIWREAFSETSGNLQSITHWRLLPAPPETETALRDRFIMGTPS